MHQLATHLDSLGHWLVALAALLFAAMRLQRMLRTPG